MAAAIAAGAAWAAPAVAQDAADLARQLANPVASLISVPFQLNYDRGFGSGDDGHRLQLNVQPVIPISLNEDWNLISRTILPVIRQDDVAPGGGVQFGLGDTVQSAFLSPAKVGPSGVVWGVGPVLLLPTATDDRLGAEKWGAGPTAVVLRQQGQWTYGGLANHIWSFAGAGARSDVNATFLQPFLTYTTPGAASVTLQTETTYDWTSEQWSVPINLVFAQVFRVGDQTLQAAVGLRWWAESPRGGPEGLGARAALVLLFPR